MQIIRGLALPIKPVSVHPYFDRVQVWLRRSADSSDLIYLQKHCGSLHVDDRYARFDKRFVQRLELKQPKQEALLWVAGRADALVNQLEVALDFQFESWAERDDAQDFFHTHLVRPWHGRSQQVLLVGGAALHETYGATRYDAGRCARNSIVLYAQPFSRITGEVHCLHIEWRMRSPQALRAGGISSPLDLVRFDYRKFWSKRLVLYSANPGRVGRYFNNIREGGKRRTNTRLDGRTGHVILAGQSCVQELIDNTGECAFSACSRAWIQTGSYPPYCNYQTEPPTQCY